MKRCPCKTTLKLRQNGQLKYRRFLGQGLANLDLIQGQTRKTDSDISPTPTGVKGLRLLTRSV